jgi:hypothetical protein
MNSVSAPSHLANRTRGMAKREEREPVPSLVREPALTCEFFRVGTRSIELRTSAV